MNVMELAGRTGVSVDTVRYYQSRGLLPPPARRGRQAVYDESHLERLARIRSMADRGFSLKAIQAILDGEVETVSDDALRAAIERESEPAGYTSEELAARVGVPHALLRSVEGAGLVEGQVSDAGTPLYSEADVRVAKAAMRLLQFGFPLTELLGLAVAHDRSMRETVDRAIDLFDDHVRKREGKSSGNAEGKPEASPEAVARAFEDLLPLVTAMVAHHFQRLLINRALERLKKSGQKRQLAHALKATAKAAAKSRLRLPWR